MELIRTCCPTSPGSDVHACLHLRTPETVSVTGPGTAVARTPYGVQFLCICLLCIILVFSRREVASRLSSRGVRPATSKRMRRATPRHATLSPCTYSKVAK